MARKQVKRVPKTQIFQRDGKWVVRYWHGFFQRYEEEEHASFAMAKFIATIQGIGVFG